MTTINLNADMGESYGRFKVGNDEAILKIIQSASIACGFHAGDPTVMANAVKTAKENGVSIGAHPGFNDLWGFGRRQIKMKARDVEYMVAYQIGALQAIAAYAGLKVTHLKPHGALSNMAATDESYALAIGRAIKTVDPAIIYVAQATTELERAAVTLGLAFAREGFADRQYEDDLTLASRAMPGAVICEPAAAAEQALRLARDGQVVSRHGKVLKFEVDTICVHGDEPTAVAVGRAVKETLETNGIRIVPLPEVARG